MFAKIFRKPQAAFNRQQEQAGLSPKSHPLRALSVSSSQGSDVNTPVMTGTEELLHNLLNAAHTIGAHVKKPNAKSLENVIKNLATFNNSATCLSAESSEMRDLVRDTLKSVAQNTNLTDFLRTNLGNRALKPKLQENLSGLFDLFKHYEIPFKAETGKNWLEAHQETGFPAQSVLFTPQIENLPGAALISKHINLNPNQEFRLTPEEQTGYIEKLSAAFTQSASKINDVRVLPHAIKQGVYIPVRKNAHEKDAYDALMLVGLNKENQTEIRLYDTHAANSAQSEKTIRNKPSARYTRMKLNHGDYQAVIRSIVQHHYTENPRQPRSTYFPSALKTQIAETTYQRAEIQKKGTCASSCLLAAIKENNYQRGE